MLATRATALVLVALSFACGPGRTSDASDGAIVQPDQRTAEDGPVTLTAWPGDDAIAIACAKDVFGPNLSGLVYEPASVGAEPVLWAVQNEPSKIFRLTWNGSAFVPVTSNAWITGKLLHYPTGTGSPDSEGLTRTEWTSTEIYVAAERDNDVPDVARQSILRYDLASTKGILDATHEWVLTNDLPAATANHGLEGIAWIPDSYLVERGFFDESAQAPYAPSLYPDHGNGVFLVGRDDTGMIYGYVLDHKNSTSTRVVSFPSEQPYSVDLTFDRDTSTLWSLCDSKCSGRMTLFDIDTDAASPTIGRFVMRARVPPPKALSSMNNEGITLAPVSECVGDRRSVFWADDSNSGGYAIRKGWITCGTFFPMPARKDAGGQ